MTSTAIQSLKAEIARRQGEIETLEAALAMLAGEPEPKTRKKMLALPAPERKPAGKKRRANPGNGRASETVDVNGVDVACTADQLKMIEELTAAEDCAPAGQLMKLIGGDLKRLQSQIYLTNKRLMPAKARIVYFPGDGYRLQNTEEGA
jgi:hypothetical protein